ncbi:AAA family ATPase [Plasmodium coatneyi]|uniref:AAA family ATPase n=1 Tax=Plasmodium coatneyi TaxID=208452 RepID=A0A1B1DSJ7_9APIC|nr:AAA family ATPase [Plasmodium coatneyi]ANQ05704.1 AAA family ATPase [Plasmodium coatneyi]
MRRSPNSNPPIENFCVYCSSNQTFSYLRKWDEEEGSSTKASPNEYQRIVLKKAVKYKWVKNLSCAECYLNVVEYLRKGERSEQLGGTYRRRDEDAGGASPLIGSTNGGEFPTVNRRFRKNEMLMRGANSLERRNRRRFKLTSFVDRHHSHAKGDKTVKSVESVKGAKVGKEEDYLFNAAARAKYYRRVSKVWLRRFLRKSGPVYKRLAKQLINFLVIKNFQIFDVELWNNFFKKKVTNHMNTNLYFLLGKEGSEKERFLEDLFLSFPFIYPSERVYVVDLGQYGRCPIVSDCRYAVHSVGTPNWGDLPVRGSSIPSSGSSSTPSIAHGDTQKRIPHVNNIIYPNLSEIIEKEEAVRGLTQRRGSLQDIDPCNENLEYILLAVTRIALVKQFVWEKQFLRGVSMLVESNRLGTRHARRGEATRKCPRVDKRTRGLNLFNGGHSFLLIKNLDKLNDLQMPPLRKSCIVQVLLKYVYLWKELNLNVHAFVLASERGGHKTEAGNAAEGGIANPHCVNPFSEFLSNCATFEFPTFELPPFLREAQRRQYLAHLFKEKGVKCSKEDLQQVAEITTSFSKADLGKLCRDECRERFIHAVRRGEMVRSTSVGGGKLLMGQLPNVGELPNLLEQSKGLCTQGGTPPESNFFHKTLNLQTESHAVIRTHEIELYKGEKRDHREKVSHPNGDIDSGVTHGLDSVIAEEELVGKLREEVVRFFTSTCEKDHPCKKDRSEPPTGILLYGKSGSGKTFLAQKIIDECNCTSLVINCSHVFNKVMGESEKFLNDVFVYAGGRVGSCVILFDGIENICYNTKGCSSHGMSKFMERLKLCFYQHLDRIHFQNKWGLDRRSAGKVLIIATTTELTNVDDNLLVDHRLRHVFCTKEFHLWRDSDVLRLVRSCLHRCNVHEDSFVLSVEFEKFFKEYILSRREPTDGISVEDFLWAAKNANNS